MVFKFGKPDENIQVVPLEPRKVHRNPVVLAREWAFKLASGECRSRADLASNLKVSRARVTQMLQLLQLSPLVLQKITDLGDPLPTMIFTERKLRSILGLSETEQTSRVENSFAHSLRTVE